MQTNKGAVSQFDNFGSLRIRHIQRLYAAVHVESISGSLGPKHHGPVPMPFLWQRAPQRPHKRTQQIPRVVAGNISVISPHLPGRSWARRAKPSAHEQGLAGVDSPVRYDNSLPANGCVIVSELVKSTFVP